jgi:hypothetical protein
MSDGHLFVLDIPDLSKRRLSLSSIFVLNHGQEASAIKSGEIEANNNSSDTKQKWQGLRRNPALRSYMPGEGFDYMAVIYNAKSKEDRAPQLEFQFTILKNGEVYYQSNREDIDLQGEEDWNRIPIVKKLTFNNTMGEGTFLLGVMVFDKQAEVKFNTAFQLIDFEIRKE